MGLRRVCLDKQKIAPDIAHPLAAVAVKRLLEAAWMRAGLRTRKVRSEFKAAHGFRKLCNDSACLVF
jgi:hypothetical protein